MWGQLIWRKFVASYNPLFWFFLVIKVWFGGALKSATVQSKRTNWTEQENELNCTWTLHITINCIFHDLFCNQKRFWKLCSQQNLQTVPHKHKHLFPCLGLTSHPSGTCDCQTSYNKTCPNLRSCSIWMDFLKIWCRMGVACILCPQAVEWTLKFNERSE